MLTLLEVKQLIKKPKDGEVMPSAKRLKDCGDLILCKRIGNGARLTVCREGYAVYEIGKNVTVFPVAACGDYEYGKKGRGTHISEEYFDSLPWYIRLLLEGEDRLCHNRETYEQGKNISYSAESDDWFVLEDLEESVLERLIRKETLEDYLSLLTERQRLIICEFYFQKKTQLEIASELNIAPQSVRRILAQAIRRIQRKRGPASRKRCCGKEVFSLAG